MQRTSVKSWAMAVFLALGALASCGGNEPVTTAGDGLDGDPAQQMSVSDAVASAPIAVATQQVAASPSSCWVTLPNCQTSGDPATLYHYGCTCTAGCTTSQCNNSCVALRLRYCGSAS